MATYGGRNGKESECVSSDNEMERKVKATYDTSLPIPLMMKDIMQLIIGPPYFGIAGHKVAKLDLVYFYSHLSESRGALLR